MAFIFSVQAGGERSESPACNNTMIMYVNYMNVSIYKEFPVYRYILIICVHYYSIILSFMILSILFDIILQQLMT